MSDNQQIKRRITSAKNISKITKAMEMVSASKMKKAQSQTLLSRPFAQELYKSLSMLSSKTDSSLHPLLSHHGEGVELLVVISTDKGLCGGLNTNLFRHLVKLRQKNEAVSVLAIGKKAVNFAQNHNFKIHSQFTDLPATITTSEIIPISSLIIEGFLNKTFRTVQLIYTDFINTLSQKATLSQLLPLEKPETVLDDKTLQKPELKPTYLFEPNPRSILEELLPFYIENALYQAFLEAKASEHSARMVAMKNASENAQDLMDELRLLFNKTRQASITSELLDITTATMSLT